MRAASLCLVEFSGAVMERPIFCGADLRGAKLDGTKITDTDVPNALYTANAAGMLTTASNPK